MAASGESSSLTAPRDKVFVEVRGKTRVACFSMKPAAPPLTEQQSGAALDANLDTSAVDDLHKFPMIERKYAYPPYRDQKFVAVSFLPSKTAVPDEDGVFGMMRLWGAFSTIEEAEAHASTVITNYDSYHAVNIAKTATPFFITSEKKYSRVTTKIRLDDVAKRMVTESVKEQLKKDKANTQELLRREKQLLKGNKSMQMAEDVEDDEDAGMDDYDSDLSSAERYAGLLAKQYAQICTIMRGEKKLRNYKRAYLASSLCLARFEQDLGDDNSKLFIEACELVAKEHESIGVEKKNTKYLMKEYGCMRSAGSSVSFRNLSHADKQEKESSELESLSELLKELHGGCAKQKK